MSSESVGRSTSCLDLELGYLELCSIKGYMAKKLYTSHLESYHRRKKYACKKYKLYVIFWEQLVHANPLTKKNENEETFWAGSKVKLK